MPPTSKFQFGRLNLIYGTAETKTQFITRSILTQVTVPYRGFKYRVMEPQLFEDGAFLYGKMVKYRDENAKVVDEDLNQLEDVVVPDEARAETPFIIGFDESIVAYHPIPSRISESQFRTILRLLVGAANEGVMTDLYVELLTRENAVDQIWQEFDVVTRLSFRVHPTNPSNWDDIRDIDEELKEAGAQELKVELSNEKGLDKNGVVRTNYFRGLKMVEEGYGRAVLDGLVNLVRKTIEIGNRSPEVHYLPMGETPEELFERLRPFILMLSERHR